MIPYRFFFCFFLLPRIALPNTPIVQSVFTLLIISPNGYRKNHMEHSKTCFSTVNVAAAVRFLISRGMKWVKNIKIEFRILKLLKLFANDWNGNSTWDASKSSPLHFPAKIFHFWCCCCVQIVWARWKDTCALQFCKIYFGVLELEKRLLFMQKREHFEIPVRITSICVNVSVSVCVRVRSSDIWAKSSL